MRRVLGLALMSALVAYGANPPAANAADYTLNVNTALTTNDPMG